MKQRNIVWMKVAVWIGLFVPITYLVYAAATSNLGANPLSEIEHFTGEWTLRLVVATLAITPARRITGWNWLIRFRRLVGLFAFFYASMHFCAYLWFDQNFAWSSIVPDIAKRRFILVGFAAWLSLVPLAITSTAGWIRRLGGKRWNTLHKLIYLCSVLGIVHFYWGQKANRIDPIIYGSVLAALFAVRIFYVVQSKSKRRTTPAIVSA